MGTASRLQSLVAEGVRLIAKARRPEQVRLKKEILMALKDIVVPVMGESVAEATISKWFKKAGDAVRADEPVAELETDKVTLEVNAPAGGVLKEIVAKEGS